MRPIKKWVHTDPTINPPINEIYNPYQSAKADLERNIDSYCSYCERPAQDEMVHVEHVQPKGLAQYNHLTYNWSNFLLGCARCNGADNKGSKDVVFNSVHLPNLNNTVISVCYGEGGFVKVNEELQNHELEKAKALVNLVGLDKRPGHVNHLEKDKRWDRRREVWEIAERAYSKFQNDKIDEETVLDLARGYGFWSVWYQMFSDCLNIKQHLVTGFRGTDLDSFDNLFNAIHRNPGHPTDRV